MMLGLCRGRIGARNGRYDVKTFGAGICCLTALKMGSKNDLTDMKNMEILKTAKSYEKSSFSCEKLLFWWQPKKDSNPHKQSQSLSCYHYTIRLFLVPQCLATLIVYNGNSLASRVFFRKIKKVLLLCEKGRKTNGWCFVFIRLTQAQRAFFPVRAFRCAIHTTVKSPSFWQSPVAAAAQGCRAHSAAV